MTNSSIQTLVHGLTRNQDLAKALKICSENTRPDTLQPVDQALVYRDVEEVIRILDASFPEPNDLFDIFLRRSDSHIQQISVFFELRTKSRLDEAIRKNATLNKTTKNIAVHAVRTAINITYRDGMLLRDALGESSILGGTKAEKLAIRMCRMHWYRQHWLQIKGEFLGIGGAHLEERLNGKLSGMLSSLLGRIAMV
jgi:hypothetical protein